MKSILLINIGLAGSSARPRRQAPTASGHRGCWIEEAHVTELTGLLREGPGGDQLKDWPPSMRIFARRERPRPGARLSLFEHEDGYRYQLRVTNLPVRTRGWRGQTAYIDAGHRVHARVEDCIRTGKQTGIGRFPSHDYYALNQACPLAPGHARPEHPDERTAEHQDGTPAGLPAPSRVRWVGLHADTGGRCTLPS